MKQLLAPACFVLLMAALSAAQIPPTRFEVASIKKSAAKDFAPRWQDALDIGAANGTRDFRMRGGTIGSLILYAYPVQSGELVGAPGWVRTEHYDIQARGGATREERQRMVRTLLAERFQFVGREQMASRPIYRLVRAAAALPPTVTAVADCAIIRAAQQPVPSGTIRPCSSLYGAGDYGSTGTPFASLANVLSQFAGRVVVDGTNLPGDFAFELMWDPATGATGADRPTLTQALADIGLKLQPGQASVPVVVVERVARPAED
jgi:uncharacterized protein (TIGR03435 family)